MARRVRAPGLGSPQLRALNARLRSIDSEIRNLQRRLLRASSARERAAIMRRLDRTFSLRETAMNDWVKNILPTAGHAGANYAAEQLGLSSRTSFLLRNVIKEIQAQTFQEVAASTRYVRLDMKRLVRQAVKETTELHVKRGLSIVESRDIIAARLESVGLKAFKDASGRTWSLDSYSEMIARTRTAQAYNAGTVTRSAEEGANAFEVFDGTDSDAECAAANGTIVSAAWAMENPIEHPNCQRAFGPIVGFTGSIIDLGSEAA